MTKAAKTRPKNKSRTPLKKTVKPKQTQKKPKKPIQTKKRSPKKREVKRSRRTPAKDKAQKKATDQDLEKALAAGTAAKLILYQSLLDRLTKGKTLKPSELKEFRRLETELESEKPSERDPRVPSSLDNVEAAAEYAGVSIRTIRYHVTRGNLKKEPEGYFNRTEIDRWIEERKIKDGKSKIGNEGIRADIRFRLARARREEFIVKQLKGDLIPARTIEAQFALRAYEFSRGLDTFIKRVMHKLAIKAKKPLGDVRKILEEEVRIMLDNYSRALDE